MHIMDGSWRLKGCPEMYLDTQRIIDLIEFRDAVPICLDLDQIAYKEIDSIDINDSRYIAANTKFPGIVVKGMQNPYNKEYRLIDGRHRLLKTINQGKTKMNVYVLSESDVMQFCNYL